ncbi:MAG: sigma 54-interacting transcriptional regulator [Phycisphaerales bacterium]
MNGQGSPIDLTSSPPQPLAGVLGYVVDPDVHSALEVARISEAAGIRCTQLRSLDEVAEAMRDGAPSVAFIDIESDPAGTQRLLAVARSGARQFAVVLLAADATARKAIRWFREGASDVILKPFDAAELQDAALRAATRATLAARPAPARAQGTDAFDPAASGIVGSDTRLQRAIGLARAAARVRSTVTIHGESGTGKSMLARAIHRASERGAGPFVEIACGSIPETLLESELFGHVKGAFTGALADKKGRFLAADGGTIFLDEINSASPLLQLKLLRVLQERRFEAVGSDETIEVDVRVIAAGNQPLERLVAEGRFREDLYYRLNVLAIELPPLRERARDIEMLAMHFLELKSAALGRVITGFEPDALDAMRTHAWPGNIRELENAVERAAVLCEGPRISLRDLPTMRREVRPVSVASSTADEVAVMPGTTLAESMRAPERDTLVAALRANGWNRSRTADSLGINRATLYRKMRDLGIGASALDA